MMKKLLIFLIVASHAFAISPDHVFYSESEIVAHGDFNDDGLLDLALIEKSSGQFRIGLADSAGFITWQKARPSGVSAVTSVAVGSFTLASPDQIALTSPSANRLAIINPLDPAIRPDIITLTGIGPESMAAFKIPESRSDLHNLIVTSIENSSPDQEKLHLLEAPSIVLKETSSSNLPSSLRRLSSVRRLTSKSDHIAYLERDGSHENLVTILSSRLPAGIISDRVVLDGLGFEFTHASLLSSQPGRNQFVCWQPGSDLISISQTSSRGDLGTAISYPLGYGPIEALFLAEIASRYQLVIIVDEGARAIILDFDGNALTEDGQLIAADGERFTIGGSIASGSLQLFSGRPGQSSFTATPFHHDGTAWNLGNTASLPNLLPNLAMGNVFLYSGEPFVDSNAELRETFHLSDWSTSFTISSGTITVGRQADSGATTGLLNAPLYSGSVPTTITHVLTSQPNQTFSLSGGNAPFGAIPPEISISPGAGKYSRFIQPIITSNATAYYRFGRTKPWIQSDGSPLTLPGDTLNSVTVEYYAEDTPGSGLKSPIFSATYTFDGLIDSDSDGVPDFVEISLGISDPSAGSDTDEDGYDDLTELLAETAPNDTNDRPTPEDRLTTRGTYDLLARTQSLDIGNPTNKDLSAASGTNIRAFGLQGELLAQAAYASAGGGAMLVNLSASPRGGFNILSTDLSFDVFSRPENLPIGREILALSPIPDIEFEEFVFQPTSGNPKQQANQWLDQFRAYQEARAKPTITVDLDYQDSLILLLTERILALKLRDQEPSFDPDTLTLTPARDPELVPLSQPALSALSAYHPDLAPSYAAKEIYQTISDQIRNPTDPRVTQLVLLAKEIYRLSADPEAGQPGEFPSPVDTLRAILRDAPESFAPGQPPRLPGLRFGTSYSGSISLKLASLQQANNGLAFILQQLTPRQDAQLTMTVTADSFLGPVVILNSISGPTALFDPQGDPFRFPSEYQLPVGTRLLVRIFSDAPGLPNIPGAVEVEVITAEVLSYPAPPLKDENRNLIDDTWEAYFFPQSASVNPFADQDGDGYSNLQELLEGTNPTLASSRPSSAQLPFETPALKIVQQEGMLLLTSDFPTEFSDQIQFSLEISESLISFAPTMIKASPQGLSTYQISLPTPAATSEKRFYRFTMSLK